MAAFTPEKSGERTVQIPSGSNPFTAFVNGKKYTYEAGTTQVVPDGVARLINDGTAYPPKAEKVDPPFESEGTGGGGSGDDSMMLEVVQDLDNGTITANYSVAEVKAHFKKKPVYCYLKSVRNGEILDEVSGMMSLLRIDVELEPALVVYIFDDGEISVAPILAVYNGEWFIGS